MSIVVGVGRAAREGVLFKDAKSLEILGQSKSLMIDKTGTLTEGRPAVTDIVLFGNQSEDEVPSLAAAIEVEANIHSPLQSAKPPRTATLLHKNTENFMSTPGFGVQGTVGSKSIALGNEAFLKNRMCLTTN